jgi:hypothetical protein
MYTREIKEKNTKNKCRELRETKSELKKEKNKQIKGNLTKIKLKNNKKRINGRKPSSKTVKAIRREKTKN